MYVMYVLMYLSQTRSKNIQIVLMTCILFVLMYLSQICSKNIQIIKWCPHIFFYLWFSSSKHLMFVMFFQAY